MVQLTHDRIVILLLGRARPEAFLVLVFLLFVRIRLLLDAVLKVDQE